jgi:PAS domain S-box-containing protein
VPRGRARAARAPPTDTEAGIKRLIDMLRRTPTIRQWLVLLLAAFILPATAAVGLLFAQAYLRERAGMERASLDVARALMQTIDRELASAEAAMQALATSPNLDQPDLRAFFDQAVAVLHDRPGNVLVLSDLQLRQVVNTQRPYGAPLPVHGNASELRRVAESGRPEVSDLYLGPVPHRLLTSVDVPVIRDGRVRYLLSMQYFGERLGEILTRQKIPPGVVASIHDSTGRVVWTSGPTAGVVGALPRSALAAGLALGPEGIVDDVAPDGRRNVTVFSRSAVSHWALSIALQRRTLNAGLWQSLAWIALGAFGLFALGLALVRAIGARIEGSVRGLVKPAMALGYGRSVDLPPLHLREAREVGQALTKAAALLHERTAERDEAEAAERQLREANRAIEQSEAFLRGIFEETPDGVLLVGPDDGVVERANGQAERLFGYRHGAMHGVQVDSLLDSASAGADPISRRIRAGPLPASIDGTVQLKGRRADGGSFFADAMASPLKDRALVILTVRDISASWENEEALRRALGEKNILLKELFHRVKNNLQLIISLFNLQARALPAGAARQAIDDAVSRVRAMALVHERLYQSRTLSSIELHSYIAELCEQLAGAASAAQRGIAVRVEAAPLECGLDVAVPLGLVLNELLTNALKHAYPGERRGEVQVRLALDAGRVRLSVRDDGVGLPADLDRTTPRALGLRLVSTLSESLRAQFTLENNGGAYASLVFPIPVTGAPARAP